MAFIVSEVDRFFGEVALSIFMVESKYPRVMLCLLFVSVMYIVAGEAHAALSCNGCHGTDSPADYRPVDASFRNPSSGGFQGNHRTHMGSAATSNTCAKCHPGSGGYTSSHRNGNLHLSSKINNSPLATPYNNRTTAWPQTSSPVTGGCESVNCHFEKTTPAWGSTPFASPADCDGCHSAPPTDGAHGKKHGQNLGTDTASCSYCHANHLAESNKFAHATSAGKRALSIKFTRFPNNSTSGSYTGDVTYPAYLPSQSPARNGSCNNTYCHSDGRKDELGQVGPPNRTLTWSGATTQCVSCHKGLSTNPDPKLAPPQPSDSTFANCSTIFGAWSSSKGYCTPDLTMASNAHHRLVGQQWIRKYPCYYCHNATMNPDGTLKNQAKHVNKTVDIEMATKWEIDGRPKPSYNSTTKSCDNTYCHSDGTSDPEVIRPVAWTAPKTECNSCHGHPTGTCSNAGCHDGKVHVGDPVVGRLWTLPAKFGNASSYHWPVGQEWMGSLPMFPNQGAGTSRANSHPRHAQTNFSCDICHNKTIKGDCASCHAGGIPPGGMGEVSHIDATNHVNKIKNVDFKDMPLAIYDDENTKTCSGTTCHKTGSDPVWGGSVNSAVTCLSCHGTTGLDEDDFNAFNGTQGTINTTEWVTTGHGRMSSATKTGSYPKSGNPAAKFPGNPCWYCHDNSVLHKDASNPFRLKIHSQYNQRFEKECVYCHMEGTVAECLSCHVGQTESLSPQATTSGILYKFKNTSTEIRYPTHTAVTGCITGSCHDSDSTIHKVHAGVWTADMKADVKNQYVMMGVCLQCHDDDSSDQCTSCHIAPAGNPLKYSLGYDPGTGFIKPKKARASSGHFGYKHYKAFMNSGGWTKDGSGKPMGTWVGGKFCWDCHDPHGDSNIYMVQAKVATTTDGTFGMPKTKSSVIFVNNASGTDYVKKVAPFNGICNVCHTPESKHFTSNSGDGHNTSRRCTTCHEHRFADSHANKQSCDSCHTSTKPIPKHTAFGLPRDCTKCHTGTVGQRMDVMGQMKSNSHHVQGVDVTNKHCYACHWETTPEGLIDIEHHTGYNYKNYSSEKNAKVDLVIYGKGVRPTVFRSTSTSSGRATATTFLASNMGTAEERNEVSKVSIHCISCHSDENNDSTPFDDCKTPNQYAWDLQSVAARYSQTGVATWGKYASTANAAQKNITKAFSAHGNAVANGGGWNATTGLDGVITDTRGGVNNKNVQCFDCHNSHGSKVVGTTSSYVTFNGTNNGANLKETKKGMGGYTEDYKAAANTTGANPYGAGAGQCFDCHVAATAGTSLTNGKTPWGYNSTFGATAPIMGYKDTPRFADPAQLSEYKASTVRFAERDSKHAIIGGHLKASMPGTSLANLAKYAGSAGSGSTTTLVDGSASGWTTNNWLNLYLLMGSGSNSGQLRKITGNTTDTLTVEAFNYVVATGDTYKIVPYSETINGLCSGCHDPHGVSTTLLTNQVYAVPLLKGTWMTSPYKEDAPPVEPSGTRVRIGTNGMQRSWGTWIENSWPSNIPSPTEPTTRHYIDLNTFLGTTRISESDDKFAGLCLSCHQKVNLTDGVNRNNGADGFKTIDRIHESVKGWGVNSEHSFTCSKCHQPHNSGLPRLMQTNCLDYKHRNGVVSGGEPWATDKQGKLSKGSASNAHNASRGNNHRGYPIGSMYGGRGGTKEATTACHVARFAPAYNYDTPPAQWPDGNYWNNVTPW